MPRAAPVMPVNAKMYRHFAIISLGITACLAVFASSGSQKPLEQHVPGQNARQKIPEKKIAINFTDKRKGGGSFGEEAGSVHTGGAGGFGTSSIMDIDPELVTGSSDDTAPDAGPALPAGAVNGLPPGMTPEEIREWQRLRERKQGASAQSEPSTAEIAAIVSASRARSHTPDS